MGGRAIGYALIGLSAAVLLALAPGAAAQTKVTIGYGPANGWIPAFVAKDQGIFAKHGLDATLQLIAIGSNQPAALMADAIQISGLNPTIVIFADEGGADIQVVANESIQTRTETDGGVLARTGSNLHTPQDLVGKKVAIPGLNSVAHVAFMKWLQIKGVDPKSATYIEIPMNRMGDALQGQQVDAAVLVEPFAGQIEDRKAGYMMADFNADLADPVTTHSVWGMRKAYIDAHPGVVAAFRSALREAMAWVAANPDAARRTQMTYLHLPEQAAMTVKLSKFDANLTPQMMQWWIDACRDLGLTKGTITLDQVMAK
jgi:NitT/TauT family transport system substrate-binding protein